MRTSINPTKQNISEIENWLTQERNDKNEGFFTNWEMIPKAFEENRISILKEDDKAIAFALFRIYDEMSVIDIAEIEPIHRGRGIARKFILDTLDILKSRGVIVVKLFCSPEKSEGFWMKCGFNRFEVPNNSQINMYKTLIDVLNPTNDFLDSKLDKLKLWDCEPHLTDRNQPKWIWELEYKNDNKTLVKPIICPAHYDWQIELDSKSKIITNKVKYFPFDIFDSGTFIIINSMENIKH